MSKKKLKFVRNDKGVSDLMKSPEMQEILGQYGDQVVSRCGSRNYKAVVRTGQKRANVTISPADAAAFYSNLKHNTLLKALKG